jgi:ubiquinone/menaquinone biosynthesis C-methylase UbiE
LGRSDDAFFDEEVGCGVGAQTSIDISEVSVEKAGGLVSELGLKNVTVEQADLFDLGFEKAAFDHIFICFVLEHLKEPTKAHGKTKELLAKGGKQNYCTDGEIGWQPQIHSFQGGSGPSVYHRL